MTYLSRLLAARYVVVHLALSDLRAKWRRSVLGAAWSVIQPIGLALLLTFVLGRLFKVDFATYGPYILSGVIVWNFFSSALQGGALSFTQAEAYIRQFRHPLAIYPLRVVLGELVVLMLASTSLFGWALVSMPRNFGWCWLSLLALPPLLVAIAWPLAALFAYAAVRFRDVPHGLGLALQVLWLISPVYFQASFFRDGGLNGLVDHNPVYHVLQLLRAPVLYGQWPAPENFAYAVGTAIIAALVAIAVGRVFERKVIFYL